NANYSTVPLYVAEVGKPIAQFIGYEWVGNYQISDFTWQNNSDPSIPHSQRIYELKSDVPDNGLARNQIKPGYIKYRDIPDENGNTDGHIDNNDRVVIGDPNPDFEGGFTNNFTYKGFDLNVFLQFTVGNDILNANRLMFEGTYRYGLNQFASYADRWSPETPNAENYVALGQGNSYYSTRVIEDGSFLRLKTIQLGYTFPEKWIKSAGINKLRCYFSAQNLITWTKYSGFDPEVSVNNSALTPGFDYSPYPRARTYVFGVSATF
ncbi:MAG: SusC/RagA family TonB-linked outer membrane protein, partial [Dysgonomonas sp.]